MRMRTNKIVEAFYVFEKAQIQFADRRIGATFNFFFFQILEKAFRNNIIIRMTFSGKRPRNIESVSRFPKIMRGKLRVSIHMENNAKYPIKGNPIKFCVKTIQPNTLAACSSSPPVDFLTVTHLPEIGLITPSLCR